MATDDNTFNPYKMFQFVPVPRCLLASTEITASAKILWGLLAQHAGKDGICFPAMTTLTEEMGLTRSQIVRLLGELERKKFIKVERAKGADRLAHRTNRYKFLRHTSLGLDDTCGCSVDATSGSSLQDTSGGSVEATPIVKEPVVKESVKQKNKKPPTPTLEVPPELSSLYAAVQTLPWFKPNGADATWLTKLVADYPQVNHLDELEGYRAYVMDKEISNPNVRSGLRNRFAMAVKFGREKQPAPGEEKVDADGHIEGDYYPLE